MEEKEDGVVQRRKGKIIYEENLLSPIEWETPKAMVSECSPEAFSRTLKSPSSRIFLWFDAVCCALGAYSCIHP